MKPNQKKLARWTFSVGFATLAPPLLGASMVFGKEKNSIFWSGTLCVLALLGFTIWTLDRIEKEKIKNRISGWFVCLIYFTTVFVLSLVAFEANGFAWLLASPQFVGFTLAVVGLYQAIKMKNEEPNQSCHTTPASAPR